MLSTLLLFTTLGLLLLLYGGLWAFCLHFGLKWVKAPHFTIRRVLLTTILIFILNVLINIGSKIIVGSAELPAESRAAAVTIVALIVTIIAHCAVISIAFEVGIPKAFQAWLPTLLATIGAVAFVSLVYRPFIFEAFYIPTNSMAPTLLGKHWRSPCPKCGNEAFSSPRPIDTPAEYLPQMICEGNFHVTNALRGERVFGGDRIVVAKFLEPRRWDLIVFQYPGDPAELYVMRLVGLPGEKITIRDGQVWADDKPLTPPDSIRNIKYATELENLGELWGVTRPAQLADDEYFVLGDFSRQSNDSRLWNSAASGHNPFAVPRSHLRGVATHIYWPVHRWRTLR